MKDQCVDLHPCELCGKHTHHLCSRQKTLGREDLSGSLLGNGIQQPRKYIGHTVEFVLEH